MAGSISHVVLAEKLLNTTFAGKNQKEFIIGNLFPDIRYLGELKREETHFENVSIGDIKAEASDFKAGVLTHSLIDIAREKYVQNTGFYAKMPLTHNLSVALKLCEDAVLYKKIDDWNIYTNYLHDILPDELAYGLTATGVHKWHTMNSDYFLGVQSGAEDFIGKLGFSDDQIKEISVLVEEVKSLNTVDAYINDFYSNLESYIKTD